MIKVIFVAWTNMIDDNTVIYEDYPQTVSDAVQQLISALTEQNKADIKKTSKEELIDLHLGLGLWIRNNFGLWNHNQSLLNSCKLVAGYHQGQSIESDEASNVIVKALWETLQK